MRMPQLEQTHDDDTLAFPMAGRDGEIRWYSVQPCDIDTFHKVSKLGLTVVEVMAGRSTLGAIEKAIPDENPEGTWGMVLGPETFAAMQADGVAFTDMRKAFAATCLWYATGMDNDVAEAAWLGKAPTPETPSGKAGVAASRTSSGSTSTTNTRKSKKRASAGSRSGNTKSSSKQSSTSATESTSSQ